MVTKAAKAAAAAAKAAIAAEAAAEAAKLEEETTDESSESDDSWYEIATPTGDYLPKLEGVNYYELLSSGKLATSIIEDREVKNVEFDAIHHETNDVRGKAVADSPEEEVEGILSVPLSVARRIRAFMEEKTIDLEGIVGMVLALQRTGEKLKTRYPSIELIPKSEYLE